MDKKQLEAVLRRVLDRKSAGDFCGCYDGDMDNRFPDEKEVLIAEILKEIN